VAVTDRPGNPVLLLQIIEQRKALLEFFEIPTHGLASGGERRRKPPAFPGKDGGQGKIFQRRKGQRICRTGVSQDNGSAW